MEIHIQLAGVHLGPYAEEKVRDYLTEGLLSLDDPARLEGNESWGTVEEILAKVAAAVPPKPAEPEIPLTSPENSTPPAESLAAPTTILPRPGAMSTDTIRIPMPQMAKAFGKKPLSVTPRGPSNPTASSKSEKARTSLLTAFKNLESRTTGTLPKGIEPVPSETKTSSFSSVPIPLPKSAESSRTLPMAVVRAIGKKSDTPEKPESKFPSFSPSVAKITRSNAQTASKALDPKRTSLLSAIKVPFAKTPPATPEAPDETVAPETQAPTPPASTVIPGKSPQTASTTPISAIRAISKKDSVTSPPPPSSQPALITSPAEARKGAPLPALRAVAKAKESEADKPTSKIKAPPSITQSLKRTTGPLPTLVETLEKSPAPTPPKVAAPPIETKSGLEPVDENTSTEALLEGKKTEPTVAAAGTSPHLSLIQTLAKRFGLIRPPAPPAAAAQLPPPEAVLRKVLRKTEETSPQFKVISPPKPPTRIPVALIVATVVFIGLFLSIYFYATSCYQTTVTLRTALKDGDPATLEKIVDFATVRQSLKDQLETQVTKSASPIPGNTDPAVVVAMMKNSIDYYVTPAELASLATNPTQNPKAGSAPMITPATAANILLGLNNLPIKTQSFSSPNHFIVDLSAATLDFAFSTGGWKLSRVELNPDFPLPPTSGSSTSSSDLGSSISAPVIDTYLSEGKDHYQNGDWDAAINDFSQVIALDPKAAVAYNDRGIARKAKNDLDGAIADYTQAIAVAPKLAEAYYNRGDAESAKGDIDAAVADYTQAINLDPKLEGAFYGRGTARTIKGDYDGAITDFTEAIALDPNLANAYSNRGFARRAKNDLDGAIDDFTHALTINPKIAPAYFNRGLSKQDKADLDGAIADFNEAITIDPKMTRAYYSRGIAKNTKNDLDGAIADYTQTLSLDPKMALAYSDRALAKQAKGDLKGALADFNQALTYDPKIAIAYYSRGLIKEQINDFDGAIADNSRALELDPRNYQAYYNRGFAKLTKGNLDGSRADLQKFCDLAPKDRYADNAHLYLWLIGMAQNNATGANQNLSDALQSNWNGGPNDLSTKIASFLLDHTTEADLLTAAASSDTDKDRGQHCEVWYFAGMKKLLAGDKPTAIDYFRRCIATGQHDYCEYILAQAELQVLAPDSSQ